MHTCRFLTCAALVLGTTGLRAALPTAGTWQGQMDGRSIMVCLNDHGASYYALRDRVAHPLRTADPQGLRWEEAPGSLRE